MKFHGMFGGGRWFLTAGLVLGTMAGAANSAQPPAAGANKDKQPVLNPPGSDKRALADQPGLDKDSAQVNIWTEARYVLEKELEIVKALKSVKGTTVSTWEHSIDGQQPMRTEFPMSYAAEQPSKLFVDTKDMRVFCDGQTVTVYSKILRQYVRRPMPEIWLLRDTVEQMSGGQVRNLPCEPMLRTGMTLEQTLRNVTSVERIRAGEYEGHMGTWVTGTAIDDRQPGSSPFTFERWYSDDDHLVHTVKQDWTAMYQDMADRKAAEDGEGEPTPRKAARYLSVRWNTTQSRELNPKIPGETFVFKPEEGDRKVDQFVFVFHPGIRDQIAMIGKPAPVLVGKDFGGKDESGKETPPADVDVASFKGKVVVLDFWATWCGPCIASLPSMQMIKEKYADKPFVLIGMNREHAGDERKVRPFLARRDLTIQQFNDVAGKAAEAFVTTNSIPCVVIIDQEGNIADIENGYLPGKEKELMAKLEKLFAGKPVHTGAELAAIREQTALPKSK